MGSVEILIEGAGGTSIDTDASWSGLRVRYRQVGSRSWSKFIAVGQPGQSLLDLLGAAIAVVSLVDPPKGGRAIVPGTQLELGSATA